MQRLISTKELAERLGMKPNTLSIWRMNGTGPPFYKFGEGRGARVRYDEAEAVAWIAERARETR